MAKQPYKYKYLAGKKFRVYRDGTVEFAGLPTVGRYGERTVSMRVPVSIAVWLKDLLDKIEEIETIRRNILGNPYNSSLEYIVEYKNILGVNGIFDYYTEELQKVKEDEKL